MKRILIIIIVTLAIILIPVYIFWQIDLKGKYDKHIKIEESFEPVLVNIATQDQLKDLEFIRNNWGILHDDSELINDVLDLSGQDNTIDGLLTFWKYKATSYSFFDPDQNAYNILMKKTQHNFGQSGIWNRKDNLIFQYMKKNVAVIIYEEKPDGITHLIYSSRIPKQNKANKIE
ncbi:MAG: hypothetical protein ACJAR1_001396 [Rubritalea sp.]|jgi:hypothetical protein